VCFLRMNLKVHLAHPVTGVLTPIISSIFNELSETAYLRFFFFSMSYPKNQSLVLVSRASKMNHLKYESPTEATIQFPHRTTTPWNIPRMVTTLSTDISAPDIRYLRVLRNETPRGWWVIHATPPLPKDQYRMTQLPSAEQIRIV